MTKEFEKYLLEFVRSNGWINDNEPIISVFGDDRIAPPYFYNSKKGLEKGLLHNWAYNLEKIDKYLLEYVSDILKKHNITKIYVHSGYQSDDWSLNNIKKI